MLIDLQNIDKKLKLTLDILSFVAEIDEFKGAWPHLSKQNPEKLKNLRNVAMLESIGSSTRIEGSLLSDKVVQKILSQIDTYTFVSRDEQEVAGYAVLYQEIFKNYEAIALNENVIKQLHGELLKYSSKDLRHRGEYKKHPNPIEAFDGDGKSLGIISQMASPFDTPRLMEELILWTNDNLNKRYLHPLLVIAIFTLVFLAIHPFQDGNGRLSRILTTLLLLKLGYHHVPFSSFESVIEQNKESYYLALQKSQSELLKEEMDIGSWIQYFLKGLQKQKKHLEQQLFREKNLALHLPKLSSEIFQYIKDHGRLTVGELEKLVDSPRGTLKKHLTDLVRDKHIGRFGKGRGTWYEVG